MGKYVNKESLTQALSINLNLSKKDAAFAVDLIFNEMSDALAIFDRKSRMGINPVTKERMMIPATKLPKFRPSQTLKNKCNK